LDAAFTVEQQGEVSLDEGHGLGAAPISESQVGVDVAGLIELAKSHFFHLLRSEAPLRNMIPVGDGIRERKCSYESHEQKEENMKGRLEKHFTECVVVNESLRSTVSVVKRFDDIYIFHTLTL